MNKAKILGLHHMSAITNDAQANVDFYTGILGLRLVKLTVNYDDPSAYHLYYGDGAGTVGSALTFFPYGSGRHGKIGAGQVTSTGLAIAPDAMGWWIDRFAAEAVSFDNPYLRGDEEVLPFTAHDGLRLELVATPAYKPGVGFEGSPVPAEKAISRMNNVTLSETRNEATIQLLTEVLGFQVVTEAGDLIRLKAGEDYLDVLTRPQLPIGQGGHGTVHHVAFRTADEETQIAWRQEIGGEGYHVSPIMNRDYFRSIYFREPGGVLFEIATDGPGFGIDESPSELGTGLRLPEMYEPMRDRIEQALPPLRLPKGVAQPPVHVS